MATKTLTWIHLSDLHMTPDRNSHRSVVLESLWEDISSFVAKGIEPDFIAFTGDIASHGHHEEYQLAASEFFEPLLVAARVDKDRLFIVPGNHDVNRNRTKRLQNPVPAIKESDDINHLLHDPDEMEVLLSPLSNYGAFVQAFLPNKHYSDNPTKHVHERIEKDGFIISITGLNSAWLSGFNHDTHGTVDDFGKLALGELQVRCAFDSSATFNIALMHHPFDWLMEVDRATTENVISKECSIILRGHQHRSDVIEVRNLAGGLLIVPAGTIFTSQSCPSAYNFGQVDLDTGNGIIYLRRYNRVRRQWQKDTESTGDELDGKVPFVIPKYFYGTAIKANQWESSNKVRDYRCVFTEQCKNDINQLGLTEDRVLDLVQNEFRSHINYFRFDIEDFPLPVKTGYIVYLDKVEKRIIFNSVIQSTRNEAQLAAWNHILTLYRRATRMAYRDQPENLLFVKGMTGRVLALHRDIEKLLVKYIRKFVFGCHRQESRDNVEGGSRRGSEDEFFFHLKESGSALSSVGDTLQSLDLGDFGKEQAISTIVIELERSLQHIHKIILNFPPTL